LSPFGKRWLIEAIEIRVSRELKMSTFTLFDPAIPLPETYPRE
jgi:hypothetical protein